MAERPDVNPWPIVIVLAVLAALGVLVLAGAVWVARGIPIYGRPRPYPAPALQVSPSEDLRRLTERQMSLLTGYGWVDRRRGLARIPVERAMAVLAEKGLPYRREGR